MFEVYVLVERKKPAFISFFGIFSFVMGGISMLATAIGLFYFLPTAVLGLLVGYFFHTRNYEFEYSFFDEDVRFAKIINKSRRKRLPGYKMGDVLMIAPSGDRSVYQYENDKNLNVRDLTSGYKNAKVYIMVAKAEKGTEIVRFEPDEKYLDAVCVKYGQKVKR